MYFNFRGFFKALRLALFGQPFSFRRWAYVLSFSVLFVGFTLIILLTRWIDEILWPSLRKVEVVKPVFIVAPPRSGTSYLQKLLSYDSERFLFWKMYQTIFPSITAQRIVDGFSFIDQKLGRPVERFLDWCEKRWFGGWDNLHTMRLDQPEEDGALYLYAFANEAIFMLVPFIHELWEVGFADSLPSGDRKKLMAYYRSCLQRHIVANGTGRTLLIKSTNSSGAVESLLEEFPDAQFITIVRHPSKSIPSSISLMLPALRAHSPEIEKDGPATKAYAKLSAEWFKHLHDFRDKIPKNQFFSMDFRKLRHEPKTAIQELYRHFDWTISAAYQQRLEDLNREQKQFKSQHIYTLEEFGLSKEWVDRELGHIIQDLNLETSH
jgi:hypothetical protein